MASKPPGSTEEENAVPHSVIAQAEAAILGEFEEDTPTVSRLHSRAAKQDYSQYQAKSSGR